ncbi:MAG: efflux RND transporter periplasmic adaptor subunit [Coriobacteriia bacterium]|nr:efflux RND transporter periplasmic adaptor subunit [Coriobacteriia bacterium]
MRTRIIVIVIALVVVAALGAGGWWLWANFGEGAEGDGGPLSASGTVEAEKIVVSSVIAGRIDSVVASEGATVASGTVLFTLDDELLQLQVQQAQAGVDAAQAALDQARKDDAANEEIRQAEARVDQANAALRMSQVQAGYATISAPTAGVLSEVVATVGENASPGKTLATLSNLKSLYVTVYIPETRIADVKLNAGAKVAAEGSDREFSAKVVYIADEAEFTPSNIETEEQRVKLVYKVRLEVDNIGDTLKPGMPVDVEF